MKKWQTRCDAAPIGEVCFVPRNGHRQRDR
jgi:hypothetical protein